MSEQHQFDDVMQDVRRGILQEDPINPVADGVAQQVGHRHLAQDHPPRAGHPLPQGAQFRQVIKGIAALGADDHQIRLLALGKHPAGFGKGVAIPHDRNACVLQQALQAIPEQPPWNDEEHLPCRPAGRLHRMQRLRIAVRA